MGEPVDRGGYSLHCSQHMGTALNREQDIDIKRDWSINRNIHQKLRTVFKAHTNKQGREHTSEGLHTTHCNMIALEALRKCTFGSVFTTVALVTLLSTVSHPLKPTNMGSSSSPSAQRGCQEGNKQLRQTDVTTLLDHGPPRARGGPPYITEISLV